MGEFLAEVTSKPSKANDDKPVVIASAILQYSKLLLIKFLYFMEKHLECGSFIPVYSDTDSIALATTKTGILSNDMTLEEKFDTIFLPIVKEGMIEVTFFYFVVIIVFLELENKHETVVCAE